MEEATQDNKKISLSLTPVCEGLKVGTKKNGIKYSVRDDRSRYFFPEEWEKFIGSIKEEKRPIYDCLINTGARIDEALHIKPRDFDWDRNTLTLRVTKIKAKKGEKIGKPRTFKISSQFARRMRKYINENKLAEDDLLFKKTSQAINQFLKGRLKKIGLTDWYNFSLHNIRKTHGNWLKALDIKAEEICLRLGHDFNTYLKHYGSASIFDRKDKLLMINILGDLYGLK